MQRIAQVLKSNGREGELLVGFVGMAPEDIDRFIKKILGNLKFKLGAEIR